MSPGLRASDAGRDGHDPRPWDRRRPHVRVEARLSGGKAASRPGSPPVSVSGCTVPVMTSAAHHDAAHPFAHAVPIPELRDVEIPFDHAPGLAELAERADRHEVLHLVRGEDAPALVVMTEDDFEQALDDADALAEARTILAQMEHDPRPVLRSGTPEWDAFVRKFTHSA
jgi:hypothetical protein